MTPMENTSEPMEKSKSWRASGAIYKGDPAFTLLRSLLSECKAKPKSATIGSPFLKNIFSGFKSRWMICLLYKYCKPLTIPSTMMRVYFYVNCLHFFVNSYKFPP